MEDDTKQINNELEKPNKQIKNYSRLYATLLGIAVLLIIGLSVALWWCLYQKAPAPSSSAAEGSGATAAAGGPCYNDEQNDLPAGYAWYENATLGYKFAYPSAWGAVTLATAPTGGTAGHYAYITFASNQDVWLGGNATDYIVNARGGMPTDNPGYLQANSAFYDVQIWKLHEGPGVDTPMYDLHRIEESTVVKNGCNTRAAVTQYPETEFFGYAYDLARVNLQPTNLYYGVNVVVKNPDATKRADLDKIIRSFQLLP